MGLILFVSLFPFFWMLRTALSTNADLVTGNQSLLPLRPTLLNIKQVLGLAARRSSTAAGTGRPAMSTSSSRCATRSSWPR